MRCGVFVLFLPYMLMAALYPKGEEMESLERVGSGLSLALVPLVGLLLNIRLGE